MTTPPPPWPPQPPPWPPQPPPWPPPPKPINAGLVILGMILGTVLWSGILLAMMALNNTATQFHNVPAEYLYIGESLLVVYDFYRYCTDAGSGVEEYVDERGRR